MTGHLDSAFDVKPPSGSTFLKYARTIQHLKLSQLAYQLRYRLWRAGTGLKGPRELRLRENVHHSPFVRVVAPNVNETAIEFLNKRRNIDIESMDWVCADEAKLWRYNLHYFDYLHWDSYSSVAKTGLIDSWISSNSVGAVDAWEPYPVSLRVVNWIKYFLIGGKAGGVPSAWQRSLAQQALWLEKNLEYHLRGNHVLKNAKALVFSGVYFSGEMGSRHLKLGVRMMLEQANEQMLADGGHFERSPMYHCICLEDFLDVVNLLAANPQLANGGDLIELREVASRGLEFLESVLCADGEIPLFNDAALGISAVPSELLAYGQRVLESGATDMRDSPARICLSESGIYGYRHDGDSLLIDCGPIGPEYQPGHAHCDILSYELCIDGRRVIIDSGVYDYEAGDLRQYLRSTAAHNTVRVDGMEQSEIWGAFRVAHRAQPIQAELGGWQGGCIEFRGAHDGYCRLPGKPIHERQVEADTAGRWIFSDTVNGSGNHLVESFIHIHPDFEVISCGNRTYLIQDAADKMAQLKIESECEIRILAGYFCPEFGKQIKNQVIVLSSRGDLPISLKYSVEKT